jgi:WD40 repeat protein
MCSALAFSHDDSLLATGGWDSRIKLWRVLDKDLQRTLTGHRDWVNMVRFSPDDRQLVSCSDDHTVRLWDVETGAQLDTYVGHASSLFDVAFASGGRSIASHCAEDGLVKIWSSSKTSDRAVLGTHRFIAFSVALAPDERTLASGDNVGEIRIWNFSTGQQLMSLRESEHQCLQLRYSHDGRWLVAMFADDGGIVWNTADWKVRKRFPGIPYTRMFAAFTPDNRTLLTVGKDGLIHGWGVGTFNETMQVRTEVRNPIGLALSPDGHVLATFHENRSLELSEFPSGKKKGTLTSDLAPINALRFSDDGRFLAVACSDGTARIWDVVTQRPHGVPMRHDIRADDVAFLPRRVVSASIDGTIRLWDLDSCRGCGVLRIPEKDGIFAVDTTADGHTIVSVHSDTNVRVWQAATPQEVESADPLRSPTAR